MTVPSAKGYIFTERLGSGTYATVYKAYRKVNLVRHHVDRWCIALYTSISGRCLGDNWS